MAEFRKSPVVDQDLVTIWEYIAADNPDAADRVLRAAYVTFLKLAHNPGMGRPRDLAEGLHSFHVEGYRNYLVFYREIEGGVEIVRVLHGARDLESLFGE